MKRVLVTIPSILLSIAVASCAGDEGTGDNNNAIAMEPSASGPDPSGMGTTPSGITPPPGSTPPGATPPAGVSPTPPGATGPAGQTGTTGPTGQTGAPAGSGGAGSTPAPVPQGSGGTQVAPVGGSGPVGVDPEVGGAGPVGTGGAGPSGDGGMGGAPVDSMDVTVQLAQKRQLMRGFGINNNWAPAMTDAEADLMFGTGERQLGMNILRVGMGSDGEPYNGANCYADINKAVARGAEYIMATLWSPPAECKSNGMIADGGHLLEQCYESWSNTIAAFADKIAANTNTTLYAMSPQNEVDFASCGRAEPCNGNYDTTIMNGAEAAAFMKIVGPKLRAKGVKPMSPEASEWIHVWSNQSACCSEPSGLPSSDPLDCGFDGQEDVNCPAGAPFDDGYEYGYALWADPEAWAAFDIMGTHQYDSQIAYAWPAEVTDKKETWQTEMSGVKWWPEQGEVDANGVLVTCSTHIENGVAVARWIHSGITVGEASAWLYWWYKAIDTDDNEGLVCKNGDVAKRLWTFGQFSKFIRPGYTMVNVTGPLPDKVLLAAAVSPEGTPVIVAINETTGAVDLPITIAGGTAPSSMAVWRTSATEDLKATDPVPVSGGVLMASLPAMSVTTFVGE